MADSTRFLLNVADGKEKKGKVEPSVNMWAVGREIGIDCDCEETSEDDDFGIDDSRCVDWCVNV